MKTIIEEKESLVKVKKTWYVCDRCGFRAEDPYYVNKHNVEEHVVPKTITINNKTLLWFESLEDAKEWFFWYAYAMSGPDSIKRVTEYWVGANWYILSKCDACTIQGLMENPCTCRLLSAGKFLEEELKKIEQMQDDTKEIAKVIAVQK